MKLLNFRAHDPNHDTKGVSRGNKLEEVVWTEYANDPMALRKVVASIVDVTQAATEHDAPVLPEDDLFEAREGKLLSRIHRYRERNAAIVKRRKTSYLTQHGHLCCEACGFDFRATYGRRGDGFVKFHHTKPVSELLVGDTKKLNDLLLLCDDCYRMVHASRPRRTLEELQTALS